MAYSSRLVTDVPENTVTLGSAVLRAEQFEVKLACPVLRKTCTDGSPLQTVLPETAAELTLSGRAALVQSAAGTLLHALHGAMAAHTAFSFSLYGCSFSQMQITGCTLKQSDSPRTADCRLTLTGSLAASDGGGI